MKVIKLGECTREIINPIKQGKIFIYPTDTIYGIGCNALKKKSVEKIRAIKMRDSKPFSVIAPSKQWIKKHFVFKKDLLKKLPGKYTLILKEKKRKMVAPNVAPGLDTLGIRIPKHPFVLYIQKAGVPFVTTSVNLSGKPHAKNLKEIPKRIMNSVDYSIDAGDIQGKPSVLIGPDGKTIKRL